MIIEYFVTLASLLFVLMLSTIGVLAIFAVILCLLLKNDFIAKWYIWLAGINNVSFEPNLNYFILKNNYFWAKHPRSYKIHLTADMTDPLIPSTELTSLADKISGLFKEGTFTDLKKAVEESSIHMANKLESFKFLTVVTTYIHDYIKTKTPLYKATVNSVNKL